jgi:hypothetical protein
MNIDPIFHALDEMVTPQVYRRNPFHLFSLAVDATPRDIRRRREDIDAALATGSIKAELSRSLLLSPDLSPHAVSEAFARLENPVTRLLDEIFAFWPMPGKTGKQDEILRQLAVGGYSAVKSVGAEWDALRKTADGIVAEHNLAVLAHLPALEMELEDTDFKEQDDDSKKSREYWEFAVMRWSVCMDSDAFWHSVYVRAEALNDPRLTPGSVGLVRRELRHALERINGALFAGHVEHQNWTRASFQLEYAAMISHGDGANRILREYFAKNERKIRLLSDEALKAAKADPAKGVQEARRVLDGSESVVTAALTFLTGSDTLDRLRRGIRDLVAETANRCQVIYANKTADWQTCHHILRRAYPIAESDGVKKQIQENIKIVVENDKQVKLAKTCWMCKTSTDLGTPEAVKVYSPVEYDYLSFGRGQFRIMEIKVPVCKTCREKHDARSTGDGKLFVQCAVGAILPGGIVGAAFGRGELAAGGIGCVVGLMVSVVIYCVVLEHRSTGLPWDTTSYPEIQKFLKQGWSLVDPNVKAKEEVWFGKNRRHGKEQENKRMGIVFLVIFGFICWLVSYIADYESTPKTQTSSRDIATDGRSAAFGGSAVKQQNSSSRGVATPWQKVLDAGTPIKQQNSSSRGVATVPTRPTAPLPPNGEIILSMQAPRVAPFTIETRSGANYLVKLYECTSGMEAMSVFVYGGRTVEVKVPLGTYEVKYGSGRNWYGYEDCFGREGSYAKADTFFTFKNEYGRITGWTITLYSVAHGNLSTENIRWSEF